jgi:predicted transposase YdaD
VSALDIIQGSAPVAIASAAFGLVGTEVVMTISEWYRAKRFAEGKAEGRVEERAEVIKALREQGFHAAAATLEAPAQEADTPPETPAKR